MSQNQKPPEREAITSKEMEAIDRNATYLGISRMLLMENAGRSVTEELLKELEPIKSVIIIAGTGNNGGDGFVAARHLVNRGVTVSVFLVGDPREIRTEEARTNWCIINNMHYSLTLKALRTSDDLGSLAQKLTDSEAVVDAMLGTGVKGPLREPIKSAVEMVNESDVPTIAVDTPTGLDPTTGEIHGVAIRARATVTFHRAKKGLLQAKENVGRLIVADIGIPPEAEVYSGPGDVLLATPKRKKTSHKGDQGRLLVVGGSDRFSGAPALTALAALRSGVDIVIVAAPTSVSQAIMSFSPNLIVHPLQGEIFATNHVSQLSELLSRVDAVALGPGLGVHPDTMEACRSLLINLAVPSVIDADALKALAADISSTPERCVLTPHIGEYKILTGVEATGTTEEVASRVSNFAKKVNVTILLKRYEDIITNGRQMKINRTGNPGMTVGGTGDVLTGIVGAFLAKSVDPFRSAVAGAFLNGLAGDLIVEEKGYHIIAGDLIEKLPEAFARCKLVV